MSVTAAVLDEVEPLLAAFAQSPDAVFVTDRNNRIIAWNQQLERLLGWKASDVIGQTCAGVLCGTDRFGNRYCSDSCPVVQIANRGEAIRRFELRTNTVEKRAVTLEVTVLNLPAPAPFRFLLSHIVRPIAETEAAAPAPPSTQQTAHDCLDARARKLTRRELEVLAMLASGLSTNDIADRLSIAPLTARNHVQNILDKLEVHSKSEAVAFAFRQKLL
jgi:DNA-binding CsgD family transcriptional regulator